MIFLKINTKWHETIKQSHKQQDMKQTTLICLLLCFIQEIAAQQPFEKGKYYKVLNDKEEVVDNGGSMDNYSSLILTKEARGVAGQLFSILADEDNTYQLVIPAYDKAIDYTSEAADNKLVVQWENSLGNIHQQWHFERVGTDKYIVSPRKFPDLALGYRKDGKLQLVKRDENDPSQKWTFCMTNEKMPKTVNAVGKDVWENEQIFNINKEPGRNTFLF